MTASSVTAAAPNGAHKAKRVEQRRKARPGELPLDPSAGPFVVRRESYTGQKAARAVQTYLETLASEPAEGWPRYLVSRYGHGTFRVTGRGGQGVEERMCFEEGMAARLAAVAHNPPAPVSVLADDADRRFRRLKERVNQAEMMVGALAARLNDAVRRLDAIEAEWEASDEDEDDGQRAENPGKSLVEQLQEAKEFQATIERFAGGGAAPAQPKVDLMAMLKLGTDIYKAKLAANPPAPAVDASQAEMLTRWGPLLQQAESLGLSPEELRQLALMGLAAQDAAAKSAAGDATAP